MTNNLRVERAILRMTQQQLAEAVGVRAEAVGVSRQTINAIETKKYVPSAVLALKIARVFGKAVEDVFSLEEGD